MAEATTARVYDEGVVLAEFPKNKREVVRIRRTEFQGKDLLDLRIWYTAGGDEGETLKPGKGIALRLEQLPDLKKALATAEKALKAGPEAAAAEG